jgi:Fur family ferric uptake transcriptional regulator
MADERERQQFLEALKGRGMRVTRTRMVMFDQMFTQHGHIDAEELLAAVRRQGVSISRASVYRNLDLMVECGLVTRHRLGRRRFLYEHVHAGLRHDHLVCRECGRVVEFVSPGISALQGEICRAHGFVPAEHTLQITGLCKRCAEAARDEEAAATATAARSGGDASPAEVGAHA